MPSVTVAEVIADGLARGGVARVFVAPEAEGEPWAPAAACLARGLAAVAVPSGAAACVMGAVSGLLAEAPGAANAPGAVILGSPDSEAQHALEQARRDHAPLIVLAARAGALAGIAKDAVTVTASSAGHWIAHAAQLAMKAPRGPVLLVAGAATAASPAVPIATRPRPEPTPAPDADALEAAAGVVGAAARPVLLAGRDCARAATAAWLRAFAESLPAPTLVTVAGKGALPDPHPLHLGVLGAGAAGEDVLARADLVIALGLAAGEPEPWRVSLPAPVVLGAEEPAAPGHWIVGHVVRGEVGAVLAELAPRLRGRARADWDLAELDRLKRDVAAAPAGRGERPAWAAALAALRDAVPAGSIAVVALGASTPALAAAWPVTAPGEMIVPQGTPPACFPLAAALAARPARPAAPVVALCEAAGLTRDEMELAAAAGGPLLAVILGGDGALLAPPGWSRVRVTHRAGLAAACTGAVASARPWVVDARPLAGIG